MKYGEQVAQIRDHKFITSMNQKPGLKVTLCLDDGTIIDSHIWLTDKSMRMARQQFKACGFDVDTEDISILKDNPQHLAGRDVRVDVYEEDYKGKPQLRCDIVIARSVTKGALANIQAGLRKAASKKADEPVEGDDIPF